MQAIGFLAIFILFIICAALFDTLEKPGTPVKIFQFMYFFSSFWSQFGPNSTTFLLAAEVYPAPVRATAHGFSAACGKLGALMPAIIYNYTGNHEKFWIVTWFGLLGFALTVLFVADTTGLDLREQERYWACIREGRPHDYHGIAIHPRHLSNWERYVLHRDRYYDPELDRQAKIDELRARYEELISSDIEDELKDPEGVSESAIQFFQMEKEREKTSDGKLGIEEKTVPVEVK
jgi:Sugar (and other) transporter